MTPLGRQLQAAVQGSKRASAELTNTVASLLEVEHQLRSHPEGGRRCVEEAGKVVAARTVLQVKATTISKLQARMHSLACSISIMREEEHQQWLAKAGQHAMVGTSSKEAADLQRSLAFAEQEAEAFLKVAHFILATAKHVLQEVEAAPQQAPAPIGAIWSRSHLT
ncbi:hypothetical protein WJX72_005823 [[Myrmecia] bisecta]|uniref:Uncharacterized protein n=1 Tax=[Myrmecia] bisecta TaxID=41462 RepID=A0AAW1R799_9CHLO